MAQNLTFAYLAYTKNNSKDGLCFGIIEIPRYFSIPGRTITIAVPKKLQVTMWKMDSVNQGSNGLNDSVDHDDYDMFHFTSQRQISSHYVFQASGNFDVADLQSQTVILFSQ